MGTFALAHSPELFGVVTLKASGIVLFLAIVFLVGGSFLMSFGESDINGTWSHWDIPYYVLVKGAGVVLSAVGALIGFKKLPLK